MIASATLRVSSRLDTWLALIVLLALPALRPAESVAASPTVLQLAAAPGLDDRDVECTLWLDDQLLAGTAHGVFAYDGVRWNAHSFADTVRWLARDGDRVLAGATRGVWSASLSDLRFALEAGSPEGNRCVLPPIDAADSLRIGTDHGMFVGRAGGWRQTLDGHRVQSLARHPQRGLLVGTWGDGLLVRSLQGPDRWLRSPAAGVTDTLSGNFVHSIAVDADGAIRLACSWGTLDSRYLAHENAEQRGLITLRDPHAYLRASLVTWTDQGWDATYLLQDYSESAEQPKTLILGHYVGRLAGSSRQQWVVSTNVGRRLHPRSILSFDVETRELLWQVDLACNAEFVLPLIRAGGVELVVLTGASDQGAIQGSWRDDTARALCIDGQGHVETLMESKHQLHPLDLTLNPARSPTPVVKTRFVEQKIGYQRTESSALWEVGPDAARPGELAVVLVDSLHGFINSWIHETDSGELLLGRDTVSPAGRPELLDLNTGTRICLLPDSLRTALAAEPLAHAQHVRLASGLLGVLGITADDLFLVDGSRVRRWDNPVPVHELSSWHWCNLLGDDMPQLMVDRGAEKRRELWRFASARRLPADAMEDTTYPLPLLDDNLSKLALLSDLPPPVVGDRGTTQPDMPWFGPDAELRGWLSPANHAGSLKRYDPSGEAHGFVPLPASLTDAAQLWWVRDPVPVEARSGATTAIYDPQALPFALWRFAGSGWIGPYQFSPPYQDSHCNGVTALAPGTSGWGSEQGLRGVESATISGRVRGLESRDRAPLLVWGDFGVDVVAPHRTPSFEPALDLLQTVHGTFVLGEDGIYRREGTGWRRDVRFPPRGPIAGRLVDFSGQVLRQMKTVDGGPNKIEGTDPGSPVYDLRRTLNYFDSGLRRLNAILELSPDADLVATSWGLHLLRESDIGQLEDPRIPLLAQPVAVLDLARGADQMVYAVVEDGRVLRINPASPTEAIATELGREPSNAVLQLLARGDELWARSDHRIERWDPAAERILQVWTLPDSITTTAMDRARDTGVWIATNQGLWRAKPDEALALPARVPGLPTGALSDVVEAGGSEDRQILVIQDGQLFGAPVPSPDARSRTADDGEFVMVAGWKNGPVVGSGWVVAQRDDGPPRLTSAVQRADGANLLHIDHFGRGLHQLTVWAIGANGRRLMPPAIVTRAIYRPSSLTSAAAILAPAFLLGLWSFDLRRRRGFGLAVLLASATVWFVLMRVFYFQLPWASAGSMSAVILGMGILLRQREAQRRVPADVAVAQLDDLLRGFRHRGGGLNPIDELLLNVINLSLLREVEEDFDLRIQRVIADVLEATDDLATQGPPLIDYADLEPTLMRRFFHRLDELRELCLDLREHRLRFQEWLARRDEHIACTELCQSFLRAVESLTELLARHRDVVVEGFFPEYCQDLQHRNSVQCEFVCPESILSLPVKQGEVAELLDNLVGNALRACGDRAAARLRLELRSVDGQLSLLFEDNGPGVPPEIRERIFDRGFSTAGSSGFGLSRCRELVEQWGGSLRCGPAPHLGGAGFEVRVPR